MEYLTPKERLQNSLSDVEKVLDRGVKFDELTEAWRNSKSSFPSSLAIERQRQKKEEGDASQFSKGDRQQ